MSGKIIRILQITDTHLFTGSEGQLLGLNTEQSLAAVLADARRRHAATDLVLATGDLVHDGTAEAYRRCFARLNTLGVPVYCLPGNHDEATTLQKIGHTGHCRYELSAVLGDWHFVMLDSTVRGSDGGHLSASALLQLDQALAARPQSHTLVSLHHQPVLMGSDWLDTMAIDNPEDFFAVIERHPQVRGIVWGHVHQAFDGRHGDVILMSTPSTCIQFKPLSSRFALDPLPPGYRWLELHPDGRIETGVERVAGIAETINFAASGY
jgi:Icc protein